MDDSLYESCGRVQTAYPLRCLVNLATAGECIHSHPWEKVLPLAGVLSRHCFNLISDVSGVSSVLHQLTSPRQKKNRYPQFMTDLIRIYQEI